MSYMEPPRSADMWSTNIPGLPPMPAAPMFGSRDEWRQWKRSRKRWEQEHRHQLRVTGRDDDRSYVGLTVEEQLTRFRRQSIGTLATVASLAALNIVTSPNFFWFLFPGVPMVIGVLSRAGKLWADGVPVSKLFGRGKVALNSGASMTALPSRMSSQEAAQRLAPLEVLQGSYGGHIRRAADDQWPCEKRSRVSRKRNGT